MGQAVIKELPFKFDYLKDDVIKQVQMIKEISILTYSDFLAMVKELNQVSQQSPDGNGKYLLFVIKGGSDASVLWKATVRIGCFRCLMNSLDVSHITQTENHVLKPAEVIYCLRKIEDSRLLTLKQFLLVYKMINYHIRPSSTMTTENSESCAGISGDGNGMPRNLLSTSMILDKIGATKGIVDMEECCICMERKPEVTLPCAHSYCLLCIEQWNVSHKTCPVCREEHESTDESWVLPEIPESSEVNAELQKALNGLTMKLSEGTT